MEEADIKTEIRKEEQLNLINHELNSLYFQLQQSNIPVKCLKEASKPFIDEGINSKRRRYVSLLTKISVIVGLFSCFVYYDPLYRYLRASGRKASIKVLPLWDWRWLHGVQCFMSNPLKYSLQEPDFESCNRCANLTEIDRLNNTGEVLAEKISTAYLNEDIPVIIENVTELWPHGGIIDVKRLRELYLDDEVMRLFMCCEFESNIHVKHGNHRELLKTLVEEETTNYYAQWQNCFKEAAKLFRQVYRRPEFLPSTIELASTNWVFISSNYSADKSKCIPLPIDDVFTMLIQLEGHIDIILEPAHICKNTCQSIKTRLEQGSALILTDVLYTVKYIPSSDEESITVGIGGDID